MTTTMHSGRKGSDPKSRKAVDGARPAFLPKTKTFEAFLQTQKMGRTPTKPSAPKQVVWRFIPRNDRLMMAVLGGIALGLIVAFSLGASAPKGPWAFDRPEAKLPSHQARHTLY
jgi:hypothetical protein